MRKMGMVVAMLLAVGLGGCVSECEKARRDFSNAENVFNNFIEDVSAMTDSAKAVADTTLFTARVLDLSNRTRTARDKFVEACR